MERLGDYTIERELARGGMGVVYIAQDPIGRRVALKLMLERTDPVERARFRREAEAIGRIQHPGVIEVHSFEQDARGRDYLVMSLIEGESLAERLRRDGPLSPRAAAELVRAIADALVVTHAAGVLHRDLKPSNVLLRAEDGAPVLTDFGLARVTDQSQRLTESGTTHGTPAYMPPEQAQGELARIGPSSDVYGLGALLFHCLTGRPPFVGTSVMNILLALLTTTAPRASSLRPEVPPALDEIVGRCLERDPASRFASAAAMREELDAFVQESHEPRPTGRPRTALALVCFILVGVLLVWQSTGTPTPSLPPSRSTIPSPALTLDSTVDPASTTRSPRRRTHPNSRGLPAGKVSVRFVADGELLSWGLHESQGGDHASVRWGRTDGAWDEAQWIFPGEEVQHAVVGGQGVLLLLSRRRLMWLARPTAKPVELLRSPERELTAVALQPRGSRLAVGVLRAGVPSGPSEASIELYTWTGETLRLERSVRGHSQEIQALAFNDLGVLISGSGVSKGNPPGRVLLHDSTGRELRRIETSQMIGAAAIDGRTAAFGSAQGLIQIFEHPWHGQPADLKSTHVRRATEFLATVSASGSIHELLLREARLVARTFSDTAAKETELVIWDTTTRKVSGGMLEFKNLYQFDVSPDGRTLALGLKQHEQGKNLELWSLELLAKELRPRSDWVRDR